MVRSRRNASSNGVPLVGREGARGEKVQRRWFEVNIAVTSEDDNTCTPRGYLRIAGMRLGPAYSSERKFTKSTLWPSTINCKRFREWVDDAWVTHHACTCRSVEMCRRSRACAQTVYVYFLWANRWL